MLPSELMGHLLIGACANVDNQGRSRDNGVLHRPLRHKVVRSTPYLL